MADAGYIPPSKSADELRKLILDAIQKTPDYNNLETYHALYEHPERGITSDDVIHALEGPWVLKRTVCNRDEWQWKYKIDSESIDGEPITIIIAVDSERKEFTVITRWRDSE